MKLKLLTLGVLLLCAFAYPAFAADDEYNPGYRSMVAWLPGNRVRVDVAVWYPTLRAPSTLTVGSWSFTSARNATPAGSAEQTGGQWPLIILSHDSCGGRFAHYDLAISLARQGYIVAAPTHDGDNADDMRYLFTAEQLPARARQLRSTLDMVLNDATLGPLVDQNRIHVVGFGNGGVASLLLAGARITPKLWPSYCISAKNGDPYCQPDMRRNLGNMISSMHFAEYQADDAVLNLEAARASRLKLLDAQAKAISRTAQTVNRNQRRPVVEFPPPPAFLPLLPPLPDVEALADGRVKSIILVSPGYSMLFDPESLLDLTLPIRLIACADDSLNLLDGQIAFFANLLQDEERDFRWLENASIPALQAVCPPDVAADMPELCESVTRQERDKLHREFESVLKAYLR